MNMEIYDIVTKLIGPIEAVGETNADQQRLENLGATIELVDRLIVDLNEAAKAKYRQEASMSRIGMKAHRFLTRLDEWLRDEI